MNRRARILAKAGPWLLVLGVLGAAGSRVDLWLLLSMWGGAIITGIIAGFAFRKKAPVWFFAALVGWVAAALISFKLLASEIDYISPSELLAYWFGGIGILGTVLRQLIKQPESSMLGTKPDSEKEPEEE